MLRLVRLVSLGLGIAEIALVAWILHNVANETTYRLYISHRVDDASHSTAAQRFDIEGSRVVPQIAMRPLAETSGVDRVAFRAAVGKSSILHVDLRPESHAARYEIRWRSASASRLLAAGTATAATRVAVPIPGDPGVV